MHSPIAPVPLSNAHRDRVIRLLSAAFANDMLSMEQLDERLAAVYRAQTPAELEQLLVDPYDSRRTLHAWQDYQTTDALVPDRGVAVAVMGGFGVKGGWMVPRHLKVWAVAGGGELDLREARFSPGITNIEIVAAMGGVELTLPEGVRVEVVGGAFLGGFEHKAGTPIEDPEAPVVRVSGVAFMGGVEISRMRREYKNEKQYLAALARATDIQRRR
jgi:hypothetical protein